MTEREQLLKEWCRKYWRKHNADGTVTDLGWSEFEDLWRVWRASLTWRHVSDQEADRLQRVRGWNPRIDSERGRRSTHTAPLSPKTVEHLRGLQHRRARVIKPMQTRRFEWESWALVGALALAGVALTFLGLRVLGVM
jgi:hypothetical protein